LIQSQAIKLHHLLHSKLENIIALPKEHLSLKLLIHHRLGHWLQITITNLHALEQDWHGQEQNAVESQTKGLNIITTLQIALQTQRHRLQHFQMDAQEAAMLLISD
jgi:hypothetical protein